MTRIWAFLNLTASRRKIGNETLAIARETRATENTLFFCRLWRSRAHLRSAVQGVPRSRFEARGGIERRDDDVRDR